MITLEQIEIYKKYEGNKDALIRCGTDQEHHVLTDRDFNIIDKFIQDLRLIERKLASKKFAEKVENDLKSNCTEKSTIEQIKMIAQNKL